MAKITGCNDDAYVLVTFKNGVDKPDIEIKGLHTDFENQYDCNFAVIPELVAAMIVGIAKEWRDRQAVTGSYISCADFKANSVVNYNYSANDVYGETK